MPRPVMSRPRVRARAMPVCRARLMPSRSEAPQYWDMITVAPEETPRKKPLIRLRMGPDAPTAARAAVPTKRPTMMVSTVLYICWKKEPSRMGKKNSRICFQITPSVMPLLELRAIALPSGKSFSSSYHILPTKSISAN